MVRNMLRALILAAAAVAVTTAGAHAQFPMPGLTLHNDPQKRTPEEQEHDKAIDDAYRSASKKIPDKQVTDPWGNVRQPQSGTPATKKSQQ